MEMKGDSFVFWVHKARRLSSVTAISASISSADIRLERKLSYALAKLKASCSQPIGITIYCLLTTATLKLLM